MSKIHVTVDKANLQVVDELLLVGLIRPMYFHIFQEEVKPTKEGKKRKARASRYRTGECFNSGLNRQTN